MAEIAEEQWHIIPSARAQLGLWLPRHQMWGVMGDPPGQTGNCLTARAHPATAVREQGGPGAPLDTTGHLTRDGLEPGHS